LVKGSWLAFVLSGACVAQAQANDRSSPLGGRSALMGNTGVALGRDGAAPFLNPATIVGIDDRSIAFSVHFLALQSHRFTDFHRPAAVDPRFGSVSIEGKTVTSRRVTALPDTLCLFIAFSALTDGGGGKEDPAPWRGGKQKFALCLATVESDDEIVPALFARGRTPGGTTTQDVSFARKWTRAHVGPTYSAQINRRLSLGASLQVAYTSMSFVQDTSSLSVAADGTAAHSALGMAGNGNSFDLTGILGATYDFDVVTVGASMQLPALHVLGSYDATVHRTFNASDTNQSIIATGSGDYRAKPPTRVSVGVGKSADTWTVEANASFDFGRSRAVASSIEAQNVSLMDGALATSSTAASYSVATRPNLNGAVGGEYFVSPRLSILGGAFTNFTSLKGLKPEAVPSLGNMVQARSHRVGVSMGLGSYGAGGEFLFGAQFGYGWGEMLAPNVYAVPSDWSVVKTQSFSALFVLAGATNLRTIKRAIEGVKNAVTPGAEPQPGKPVKNR
jgi:hypothetical protein